MTRTRTDPAGGGSSCSRRDFLQTGAAAAAALSPLGSLLGACARAPARERTGQLLTDFERRYRDAVSRAEAAGAARELRLVAEVGEVEIGPLGVYRTWLYNGSYPGPEIRLTEGERLRVTLENRLPEETTIHWHGIPLPNAMDGVPGVTQPAVPTGGEFVYDFVAEPAGTYMYHSHVGLQLDRGLLGSLVVEERSPHDAYDREYVLVLDDYLPGEPTMPATGRMRGMMGRGRRPGAGRGMGAMSDAPDYAAFLLNGRPPQDPAVLEVRPGDRMRLRLSNPGSATTFRVAVDGHRMRVTHTDGRPVEPVTVDSLTISMGERYDVLVDADHPGTWAIVAESVDTGPGSARAILRYAGSAAAAPAPESQPAGLRTGRSLRLADLRSLERDASAARAPDRALDLVLAGGMMMSGAWTINGQAYPDADPLPVRAGERLLYRMVNRSPMIHPMHLHGHFFDVAGARMDTVLVPPHMGRVDLEFTADNPGDWFFHCHNTYHMESGMARVVRFVS